jgi:hypothetical protein
LTGRKNSKITLTSLIKNTFDLEFAVDDNGSRTGIITELNANNTTILQNISLRISKPIQYLTWNPAIKV